MTSKLLFSFGESWNDELRPCHGGKVILQGKFLSLQGSGLSDSDSCWIGSLTVSPALHQKLSRPKPVTASRLHPMVYRQSAT